MKNVLLVDDDAVFNFLSTKTLERMGFVNEIHAALNGKEALDLFNDYYQGARPLPDIILLDLSMPMMDGFEFMEAFKKLPLPGIENVKVIIVTSSLDPTDKARAKALGMDHYLTKPLREETLLQALNNEWSDQGI
jgi:CheY-like chemotaxis protein